MSSLFLMVGAPVPIEGQKKFSVKNKFFFFGWSSSAGQPLLGPEPHRVAARGPCCVHSRLLELAALQGLSRLWRGTHRGWFPLACPALRGRSCELAWSGSCTFWENFSPPLPPWWSLRQLENPPTQEFDFLSPLQTAYTAVLLLGGSLLTSPAQPASCAWPEPGV